MTEHTGTNGERTDRAIRSSAAYQQILDAQRVMERQAEERHKEVMAALARLNGNPLVAVGRAFQGGYRSLVAVGALAGVIWFVTGAEGLLQDIKAFFHH